MLEALIAGQGDPKRLAGLVRGKARARLAALEDAADGRFTDHHARLARMLLDQIDGLTRRVDTVTGLRDRRAAALMGQGVSPRTVQSGRNTGKATTSKGNP